MRLSKSAVIVAVVAGLAWLASMTLVSVGATSRDAIGKTSPAPKNTTVQTPRDSTEQPSQTSVAPSARGSEMLTPAGPSAPVYKLDWYSINGGGATDASSVSLKMGLSVGQSVAGEANSASYKMGAGFWYGAGGCNCPFPGDPNGSGRIDILDVVHMINACFRNGPIIRDPACPVARDDFNGNGTINVIDVAAAINHVFKRGPGPVVPC